MSTVVSTELQEFSQFIQAKLAAGEKLSPEEAVEQWRVEHPSEEEFEDNVQAIQEALDEMNAGERGKSVEQLRPEFDEFRKNRDSQPETGFILPDADADHALIVDRLQAKPVTGAGN